MIWLIVVGATIAYINVGVAYACKIAGGIEAFKKDIDDTPFLLIPILFWSLIILIKIIYLPGFFIHKKLCELNESKQLTKAKVVKR